MVRKYIFCLVVLLLTTSCSMLPKEDEELQIPVVKEYEIKSLKGTKVVRDDLIRQEKFSGTFKAGKQERLAFSKADIPVANIYVSLGDTVEAGQLLAELDNRDIVEQLKQKENSIAQMQLDIEKKEQNNNLQLKKINVQLKLQKLNLSEAKKNKTDTTYINNEILKLEQSIFQINTNNSLYNAEMKSKLDVADLDLKKLNASLEETQLRASISGEITYLKVVDYSYLSQKGITFILIQDRESSFLTASKIYSKYISTGSAVTVMYDNVEYEGKVVECPKEFDNIDSDFFISVSNLPLGIKSGDSASITVVLAESKNTLFVLKRAITIVGGDSIAYVIEDGLRTMVKVKTGLETATAIEILEGLEEGQVIALD